MGFPIVFPATMVSGNTLTSGIDLGDSYRMISIEVPSTTGVVTSPIYVQVSSDGTTFRKLAIPSIYSGTAQTNDFAIVSAASNRIVALEIFGFRYIKLSSDNATGADVNFKIICAGIGQ